MKISPLDIRRQGFKKSFRGYDVDEVTHFLEMVASEMETTISEMHSQKEKIASLEKDVERLSRLETTLQDTLISAQKTSEDYRENAKKESEIIIREAELRGDKIVTDAQNLKQKLKNDIINLTSEKESFLARFRSLIKSQLEVVTIIETDDSFKLEDFDENPQTEMEEAPILQERKLVDDEGDKVKNEKVIEIENKEELKV